MALIAIPMGAFAQQKFGHVNPAAIMQAMPEYTTAQSELKDLQTQFEGEMKIMQDELQKKGEEYEKQKDTLPANIKERRKRVARTLHTFATICTGKQPESAESFSRQIGSYQCKNGKSH